MLLLKFSYIGWMFESYSIQPGKKTVEGSIIDVLKKFNIAEKIMSSSRTDRGVSALGNVIGIKTDQRAEKIAGILNSNLHGIYFHSYAIVDDNFNPRWAKKRWYRYFWPYSKQNINEIREKSKYLLGEHDFSGFSRMDGRNPVRKIYEIDVNVENNIIVFDIIGESFLWNMVRRIVGYLLFESEKNLGKFTAPAQFLILMDVEYDFPFIKINKRIKNLDRKMVENYVYYFIYRTLLEIQRG